MSNNSHLDISIKINLKGFLKALPLFLLFTFIAAPSFAQKEFDKTARDKNYKKGTNTEYYKNGSIKLISEYKRKVWWYYTETYWTIKEYDMKGNLVRLTKKITQTARRENREKIIKEEVFDYDYKRDDKNKESIRPDAE